MTTNTRSRRQATLANLAGGGLTTMMVTLQAVVLIPLYFRYVGTHMYGAWLGSGDFLIWMQAFDLGLPNLMVQRIAAAHAGGDNRSVGAWFFTGAAVLALIAAVVAAAGYAIAPMVAGWVGTSGPDAHLLTICFRLGVLGACLSLFNNVFGGFARAVQDTVMVNVVVLAATAVGFVSTLALLLTGSGLWAIPLGMAIRSGLVLAGCLLFVLRNHREMLAGTLFFERKYALEFLRISPSTTLAGLSYSLMNQSDTALVAILIRPEVAAIYNMTKKACDIFRGVIDTVASAAYAGFAHLVNSPERNRSLMVYSEILSLRMWLALAAAAAYMATNESVLRLWLGNGKFGGQWLTICIAVQMVVGGGSYLVNNLYRAAVSVQRGSIALTLEAALRVPMMAALLMLIGLPGVPLGGILVSSAFYVLVSRQTQRALAAFSLESTRDGFKTWLLRGAVLAAGAVICLYSRPMGWLPTLLTASLVGALSLTLLCVADRRMAFVRDQIRTWSQQISHRMEGYFA